MMNGAPEGDIFEMIVHQDGELIPFSNVREATAEFASVINIIAGKIE